MPDFLLTKTEARLKALERWRALPHDQRATVENAAVLAAALAAEMDFPTMANTRKVIFAWLVKDLHGQAPWGNVPPRDDGQCP